MKKIYIITAVTLITAFLSFSNRKENGGDEYVLTYIEKLNNFNDRQLALLELIEKSNTNSATDIEKIREQINLCRIYLKGVDFWLRYLEPYTYKKINGPLSVEWEIEILEKFEEPHKVEGAGLTLAALYLDEENIKKDSLLQLVQLSINAAQYYHSPVMKNELQTGNNFYFCNRLYLLNLATIYTTGFECPDTARIIPELRSMLTDVGNIYDSYNLSFPSTQLSQEYLTLYKKMLTFANSQSSDFSRFDNFTFLKNYINPLFKLNQQLIHQFNLRTRSYVDYSLNNNNYTIFSKSLYTAQNPKGIYSNVKDEKILLEIKKIGKLLFYDPILSGNNKRSCASCHKPTEYFTDTTTSTSMQFNHKDLLLRNPPTLINALHNQLLMLDGKHAFLQNQAKDVISNALELGGDKKEVLKKILSCPEYNKAFTSFLKYSPYETEINLEHIVSAITLYYSKFSDHYSPFDAAMNENKDIDLHVKEGFNLFMSKAQCATCHFIPQFNGVKPPFVNSEFEILGVPEDTAFKKLSDDKGRFNVYPSDESLDAFRTGSIRNAEKTKPYMHNGVFSSLNQVIDFYNAGGGVGRGLKVDNQTLSSDSLRLTPTEKNNLISFIKSLNEEIEFDEPPAKLPSSKNKVLNKRKVGGEY
ncbi:MAG: cytochrome C peroxidase [Bacteroidota bacterium]|nr:cytochrome C peroxidase [Bacteroidota bacterium]